MSTQKEPICCTELEQIKAILEECDTPTHPEFFTQRQILLATVCLCQAILLVSQHGHHYHHGSGDVPDENRLLFKSLFCFYS